MTPLGFAKEREMLDSITGYKGLMSAVVTRAILDALVQPNKNQKIAPVARDALRFLLGKDVGLYLQFLDIDQDYFQRNLVNSMFKDDDDQSFNPIKKRMFRMNYKRFIQEQNRSLIAKATYQAKKSPHRRLAS
jgi:hypothetical protein